MWYIHEIKIMPSTDRFASSPISVSYYYYNVKFVITRLTVRLKNTENREELVLSDKGGWRGFVKDLELYKPYGWCPGGYDVGDCMLCVIDMPSLEFLDCIDSVCVVSTDSDEDFKAFCMSLRPGFSFWDEWRTIIDCSSAFVQMAFPLFQAVCYLKSGWIDDKFYLRGRTDAISCIKFSNLHKAKAMLAKAAVKGYNPMAENDNVKSKLEGRGYR